MTNTTLNAGWTNFYREIARGDCALQFTYTAIEPEHTEYRYNDANELENFVTNIAPAEKFTYDEWSRTITKSRVDGATTYEAVYMYRYGDKLKRVDSTFPNEKDVAYVCDGLGKRRIKSVDPDGTPEKTLYRWAGWSVLAEYGEYTGQGGEWNTFGERTRTYLGASEVLGSNPQTGTYHYALTDHLGSVREMRGQDKTLLARHSYYPYGTTLHTAGLPLNRGFTGHQWEPETGQYFAPFRYYNPSAARWTMRDPLGYVDGANLYGYLGGEPINYLDKLGGQAGVAVCVPVGLTALDGLGTAVGGILAGISLPVSAPVAAVAVAGAAAVVGVGILWSKSRNDNHRDSEIENMSPEEIQERIKSLSGRALKKFLQRLKRHQKAKGERRCGKQKGGSKR